MMFRMSVFTEASFALSFDDANFGMAMAARSPITTTTVSSSIKVKPLRLNIVPPPPDWTWPDTNWARLLTVSPTMGYDINPTRWSRRAEWEMRRRHGLAPHFLGRRHILSRAE